MEQNIHYVNNTSSDIRAVFPLLQQSYNMKRLHEDLEDLFVIEFISGLNADGSLRMIINAA